MMRWVFLAVLVVAITAAATIGFHDLGVDTSFSGGTAFPVGAKRTGPQPKAVVEGDLTYHFGAKAQQTKFDNDWIIRNDGKGDLVLKLESPPCSCTVGNFEGGKSEIVVKPGGRVPLHFTWDTRENNGKYQKPATLLTNDTEHPKFTFVADGTVQPAVVVFPPGDMIQFMEISTDQESHDGRIAVYSPDRRDMKITSLTTSSPFISAKEYPLTKDDRKALKFDSGYRVMVTVKRGIPLGAFREELVIKTDHPLKPEVRVTLMGKMVGPITANPVAFLQHHVSSSEGVESTISLIVRGGRETKFEVVQKPEKLKVAIGLGDKTQKVMKYPLNVIVPPGIAPGRIDDVIVLKTDHPQAAEVRIPVDVWVFDAG